MIRLTHLAVALVWLVLAVLAIALLLTMPFVPPVIASFTRWQAYGRRPNYTWGWLWGTYDNPPQGDEGWVSKRCPLPGKTDGLKGYLNRLAWMFRNPLYGFAKLASVKWKPSYTLERWGAAKISDKYKISGWQFTLARNARGYPVAFELYVVKPWSATRDLRLHFGWKILSDKKDEYGFCPHTVVINPFDGYGND